MRVVWITDIDPKTIVEKILSDIQPGEVWVDYLLPPLSHRTRAYIALQINNTHRYGALVSGGCIRVDDLTVINVGSN